MTFKPERYMKGPEADRALPSYSFGLGRRSCPGMLLAQKEIYAALFYFVEWFQFELFDGEKEFDPVKANDSPYQFNQGPKAFRLKVRPRDQAKLEAYLSTSDYDKVCIA
jgi:cytochrome P450